MQDLPVDLLLWLGAGAAALIGWWVGAAAATPGGFAASAASIAGRSFRLTSRVIGASIFGAGTGLLLAGFRAPLAAVEACLTWAWLGSAGALLAAGGYWTWGAAVARPVPWPRHPAYCALNHQHFGGGAFRWIIGKSVLLGECVACALVAATAFCPLILVFRHLAGLGLEEGAPPEQWGSGIPTSAGFGAVGLTCVTPLLALGATRSSLRFGFKLSFWNYPLDVSGCRPHPELQIVLAALVTGAWVWLRYWV